MHKCEAFEELLGNSQDGVRFEMFMRLEMFLGLIIIAKDVVDTGAEQLQHETRMAAVGSCVYERVEQTDDMICSVVFLQRTQRLQLPRTVCTVGGKNLEADPLLLPMK